MRQVGRRRGDAGGFDVIDELIEALAATAPPIRVVLDDLQELAAPQALRDLARIIRSAPAGLRLVLASRMDPPLPLPRLRLEGRLHELRAADLRFAADDATTLMHTAGLGLTPEQISVLVARTEGWAAGLRFAALALRSSDDPQGFIARFSGSDESVAGYLTGEVMTRLPAQSVQLLRVAAVCAELSVGLAVALLGRADAGQLLDDLARGTALVQRTHPATYRIHPLLRTYLTTDLESHLPELYRRSHIVAAHWWLAADDPLHALRHAQRAAEPAALHAVLRRLRSPSDRGGPTRGRATGTRRGRPVRRGYRPVDGTSRGLGRPPHVGAVPGRRGPRTRPPDLAPQPGACAAACSVRVWNCSWTAERPRPGRQAPDRDAVPAELEALRELSFVVASVGTADAIDANELRGHLVSVTAVARERDLPYLEVWAHSLLAEVEVRRGRYRAMRAAAEAAVTTAAAQGHQPADWADDAGALLAYGDLLAGEPESTRTRAETILATPSPVASGGGVHPPDRARHCPRRPWRASVRPRRMSGGQGQVRRRRLTGPHAGRAGRARVLLRPGLRRPRGRRRDRRVARAAGGKGRRGPAHGRLGTHVRRAVRSRLCRR